MYLVRCGIESRFSLVLFVVHISRLSNVILKSLAIFCAGIGHCIINKKYPLLHVLPPHDPGRNKN